MLRQRSAWFAIVLAVVLAAPIAAQEHPARRVAQIVSVAVEEYAKGVDEAARVIALDEFNEAVNFLKEARKAAGRLTGDGTQAAKALLDSIIVAAESKKSPRVLAQLERRFAAMLGSEAALELPQAPLRLSDGRAIFERDCASCHGISGDGNGPMAAQLKPTPAPIGNAKEARAVSPATMFRVISVGMLGTPMVGFADALTPEQRWSVVAYLSSMRSTDAQNADGEGLFAQRCAQCHGASGSGDGAYARGLSRVPAEIGSFAWLAARSDDSLAKSIRDGVPGTPMPGSRDLTEPQIRSLVAYLRSVSLRNMAPAARLADANGHTAAARQSALLLEQALAAARLGRSGEASDKAFDAYMAFEPIEARARAKNPGLVATMERHFADFKAAVRDGDLRTAEKARNAVEAGLPAVLDLTRPTGSGLEAFWQSFLIILREGFEAILVIGAIVALLLKTGHRERLRSIWRGVIYAVAASAVTAIILKTALGAMPASREIIEGLTLLVAVGVLFSVSYWLISKVEAANWKRFINDKVNEALQHGGGAALTFVAFLAVYREGAETALFYQALFSEGARVAVPILLGILFGGIALAVIFTLFYRFGVRIPLRPFFSVTSVLLYYMAFVFMGKAVRELQEGNWLSMSVIQGFPSVEALGLYPTWESLLAQLVLLALFVFAVAKTFWPKRSVTLPTVPVESASAVNYSATIAELRADNEALRARLAALEEAIGNEVSSTDSER